MLSKRSINLFNAKSFEILKTIVENSSKKLKGLNHDVLLNYIPLMPIKYMNANEIRKNVNLKIYKSDDYQTSGDKLRVKFYLNTNQNFIKYPTHYCIGRFTRIISVVGYFLFMDPLLLTLVTYSYIPWVMLDMIMRADAIAGGESVQRLLKNQRNKTMKDME